MCSLWWCVKVTFLGFASTTGAHSPFSHAVVDRVVAPPEFAASMFSEKLIFLRASYQPQVTPHAFSCTVSTAPDCPAVPYCPHRVSRCSMRKRCSQMCQRGFGLCTLHVAWLRCRPLLLASGSRPLLTFGSRTGFQRTRASLYWRVSTVT